MNSPARTRPAMTALFFCCLVAFLDGADTQSLAIAAPSIARQIGIGPAALGVLFSCNLFGAAIGAVAGGALVDRIGAHRMLALSAIGFGIFQLATSFAPTYPLLLLLRFFAGLGLGAAAPSFLVLGAATVSPDRRQWVVGFIWACFPLGGFVGGFVNGWLVQNYGWPTMFLAGGVVPIAVGVLLALLVNAPARDDPVGRQQLQSGLFRRLALERSLRNRTFLLSAIYFCSFGTLAAVGVWMPSMLMGHGFSTMDGGQILSWHALGALISMASAGFLIQRCGVTFMFVVFLLAGVALALLGFSLGNLNLVALMMIMLGILLGVAAAGAIVLAQQSFPPDLAGTGSGFTMAIGRVGQMILPAVMGWLLAVGLTDASVLLVCAAIPVVGGIAAFLFSASRNRTDPEPAG